MKTMDKYPDRSHRSEAANCPCGKPRVKFIGQVPTCQSCIDKDKVWQADFVKWAGYSAQEKQEQLKARHIQRGEGL
jgi:hypothetical protein